MTVHDRLISFLERACLLVAAAAVCWAQPAGAQPAQSFERPITIYVAGTAGSGIDLFARLVARHIGEHIPGHPTVTVQVMPGAGGIRAANFMAQQAPRDGTALASFANGPILEPLIGARHPGYDMSQFTWIGALTKDVALCLSFGPTQFKTIEDAKKEQMVVAGTGAGSETDTYPVVLNDVLGTKFKVVTGYLGTQETILAMERGEVHGRCTLSLSALKIAKPDWLREKKVNLLLQIALEKSSELPDVPLIFDLLRRDEDRQMFTLMTGSMAMARPITAPPGLPPATAALLRAAFDATVQDKAFLAEAATMRADITPTTGADVQKTVGKIYATPQSVIEQAKKYFAPSAEGK
jgi:tripartite-type tricarboxylate transporter receptor subunit TctC